MTTTEGTDPRVHAVRISSFEIPARWRETRLGQSDRESEEAHEFVEHLRDRLVTKKRRLEDYPEDLSAIGRGLLWTGSPGTGKTTEGIKVLLECYFRWNIPVFFIGFADYISGRKEQWSLENRPEAADRWWQIQRRIESVREVPVLMIDDVGKQHDGPSRFAANELDLLLRQRHRDGLPTLITTNTRVEDWGSIYNESMGSFVKEAFDVVTKASDDLRERKEQPRGRRRR